MAQTGCAAGRSSHSCASRNHTVTRRGASASSTIWPLPGPGRSFVDGGEMVSSRPVRFGLSGSMSGVLDGVGASARRSLMVRRPVWPLSRRAVSGSAPRYRQGGRGGPSGTPPAPIELTTLLHDQTVYSLQLGADIALIGLDLSQQGNEHLQGNWAVAHRLARVAVGERRRAITLRTVTCDSGEPRTISSALSMSLKLPPPRKARPRRTTCQADPT